MISHGPVVMAAMITALHQARRSMLCFYQRAFYSTAVQLASRRHRRPVIVEHRGSPRQFVKAAASSLSTSIYRAAATTIFGEIETRQYRARHRKISCCASSLHREEQYSCDTVMANGVESCIAKPMACRHAATNERDGPTKQLAVLHGAPRRRRKHAPGINRPRASTSIL